LYVFIIYINILLYLYIFILKHILCLFYEAVCHTNSVVGKNGILHAILNNIRKILAHTVYDP